MPPHVSPPQSLGAIGEAVVGRISSLLAAETDRWSQVDPSLDEPIACLRALVEAGGKRLRPAFCHWAFVGAGGDPADPRLVDAEAALELLHSFALLHDDVMDGSAVRRGRPTVHADNARLHQSRGWSGEPRRFGEGVAILVGDLAFVYADMLMAAVTPEVFEVFAQLRLEVNIGQYLDLRGTALGGVTVDEARRICRYKSGLYTVERPLHLGAALAGRGSELNAPLSDYGAPLGEAFQLRDDLLGAFGDEGATGKPVGEDFREGKPTLLHALARSRATGAQTAVLSERFGAADMDDADVDAIRAVLESTGARAEVEARIEGLTDEALSALDRAGLTPEATSELATLAVFVAGRDR